MNSRRFSLVSAIVQSEFAEKLTSASGERSYRAISVIAQISFQIEKLFRIGRINFDPPPRVESTAISLIPKFQASHFVLDHARIRTIDFIFSFRGRRLSSALKKLAPDQPLGLIPEQLKATRVENLTPGNYQEIILELEGVQVS